MRPLFILKIVFAGRVALTMLTFWPYLIGGVVVPHPPNSEARHSPAQVEAEESQLTAAEDAGRDSGTPGVRRTSAGTTLALVTGASAPDPTVEVDNPLERIRRAVDGRFPRETPHKVHRAEHIALLFVIWKIQVNEHRLEELNPPVDRGIGRIGPAKFCVALEHLAEHKGARVAWLYTSWAGRIELDLEMPLKNYVNFIDALAKVRAGKGTFSIRWER